MTKRKHPSAWARMGRPCLSFHAKVLSRVIQTASGCWQWTGKIHKGYGITNDGTRPCQAHRYCYERLVGKIPAGLQLDHLCRNKACINPRHLEPVTASENIKRAYAAGHKPWNAGLTHCKSGHPLSGENVRVANGRRWCRACEASRWQNRKAAMHANSATA